MATLPDRVLATDTGQICSVIGMDHDDITGALWFRIRRPDTTTAWLPASDTVPMGA